MTDTTLTLSPSRLPRWLAAATLVAGVMLASLPSSARAASPLVDLSGAAVESRWIGGAPAISVGARVADYRTATIASIEASLDGEPFAYHSYDGARPGAVALYVYLPTTRVSDGPHTVTVKATDSNGEVGTGTAAIRVDNQPPAPPSDLVVEGGTGWRAQPEWRLRWANPSQQFSPVVAVRYRLCPADADSGDPALAAPARDACVSGELQGPELTTLPAPLQLPKPGLWTLRVWLVDAAGNSNPDAAAVVSGLGYDPTPPRVAGFAAQDPSDPTRITVAAADDVAPLSGGAIEVRHRGAETWRPLATDVGAGGVTALVDDESLRKGVYKLRATVVNAAGLQHGTDRGADGTAKTLRLPIRLGSRLQAGRRVGKLCRGRGAKRRCRYKLSRRVAVEQGRRITLRARLTAGGKPIANQALEVWQRVSVTGADWQRIGTVPTDARGRLRYKTDKGPARNLRFRYPGTPLMRGDNADVALRVQAKTTLAVSRRSVINGEYVMFRGRLKGGPRPAGGVLVELQVRSRGKWRTFAQPRADAVTGAWEYQYRFETVSGGARFRFRARVRRQASYPYATGSSRVIGVKVHGL